MPTYVQVRNRGQITIPQDVRRKLNIKEGDLLEISVQDSQAVVTVSKAVPKEQAYFWTERWQTAEREAEEDIAAKRVRTVRSPEELQALLDELKDRSR